MFLICLRVSQLKRESPETGAESLTSTVPASKLCIRLSNSSSTGEVRSSIMSLLTKEAKFSSVSGSMPFKMNLGYQGGARLCSY